MRFAFTMGVIFLVFLLSVIPTFADTSQGIQALNCGARSANPQSCTAWFDYACDISTTSSYLTYVTYYFSERNSAGVIVDSFDACYGRTCDLLLDNINNNFQNDTFVTVGLKTYGASVGNYFTLDSVFVMDSQSTVDPATQCWFSSNTQVNCIGTFSSRRTATTDCAPVPCEWFQDSVDYPQEVASGTSFHGTTTPSTIGSGGTTITTYEPYGDCNGASSYNVRSGHDYCKPLWSTSVLACIRPQSSILSGDLRGVTTGSYIDLRSCYNQTHLASDLTGQPSGSGESVDCQLDYWLTTGKDEQGSHEEKAVTQIGDSFSEVSTSNYGAENASMTGDLLKPIVFDFNNDGLTEIVVFEENGWAMYGPTGAYPPISGYPETFTLLKFEGQPSFFGFSAYPLNSVAKDLTWYQPLNRGDVGGGFAAVMYNSTNGHDYFVSFRYEGGLWVQHANLDLSVWMGQSGRVAAGADVSCIEMDRNPLSDPQGHSYCYFVDSYNQLNRMDALFAGTEISWDYTTRKAMNLDGFVGPYTEKTHAPVFVAATPGVTSLGYSDRVIVTGWDGGSGNAAIYNCDLNLTDPSACSKYLLSGYTPSKVSPLAVVASDSLSNPTNIVTFTTIQ